MNNILKREYIVKHRNHRGWYYTFECDKCQTIETKQYHKNKWTCLCKRCSKGGLTTEEFIVKSKELYADKYSYKKTVYISTNDKLIITCKLHGDIQIRAGDHLYPKPNKINGGCKKCAIDNITKACTLSLDRWENRLLEYPLLSLVSYTDLGYHKPITLNCKLHGYFDTTFGAINQKTKGVKYICKQCSNQSHQIQSVRSNLKGTSATLYLVYIPHIDMYKLGVTTQPLYERLSPYEFETILDKSFEYEQAINIEHIIHTQLNDLKYKGSAKLLREGNTELYKINILGKVIEIINRDLVE